MYLQLSHEKLNIPNENRDGDPGKQGSSSQKQNNGDSFKIKNSRRESSQKNAFPYEYYGKVHLRDWYRKIEAFFSIGQTGYPVKDCSKKRASHDTQANEGKKKRCQRS